MIRNATSKDIPAVMAMVAQLHAAARIVLPIDPPVLARFLSALLASPLGLLRVVDKGQGPIGFLAASWAFASISAAPVAIEHGWWCGPEARGGGLQLLVEYEAWAKAQGCRFIRMSTPPDNERAARILEKRGFVLSEIAWVKAVQ